MATNQAPNNQPVSEVSPKDFFSKEEQALIETTIKEAEAKTSGEIRVHLETHCDEHVLDRAADLFAELGMHKTKDRNGVLIYLAIKDHKFAIIGDAGINSVVPTNFWDDIKIRMQSKFRSGNFLSGLSEGIKMAGDHLKKNFPREVDDVNELSDKISFGA